MPDISLEGVQAVYHKRSTTAGAIPTAGQIGTGELALNITDGKLFFKKTNNDMVTLEPTSAHTHVSADITDLGEGATISDCIAYALVLGG